jgi:hypothetical protein
MNFDCFIFFFNSLKESILEAEVLFICLITFPCA